MEEDSLGAQFDEIARRHQPNKSSERPAIPFRAENERPAIPFRAQNERPAVPFTPTRLGYISGDTSYPLSRRERDSGGLGYEDHEWESLAREDGGVSNYPLRDNHGRVCGRLLNTRMRYDTSLGRPVCNADALVDLTTPDGRAAWAKVESGEYRFLSHGFDAYRTPGSSRYKNKLREISLVKTPALPEARILVRCSAEDMSESTTDTAMGDAAPAAPSSSSTAAPPSTTTTAVPQTKSASSSLGTPAASSSAQAKGDDMETSAVPHSSIPAEVVEFAKKAPRDPKGLVHFSYENHAAAEQAKKEAAEARAKLEQAQADLAELQAIREQRRQAHLAEQKARVEAFLPLLQSSGMDIDTFRPLLDEIATNENAKAQSVPFLESLAAVQRARAKERQELAEMREQLKRQQEENERQQQEYEKAQAFLGLLNPTPIKPDQRKRAQTKIDEPAKQPPKRQLDAKAASLLNLDKLDRSALKAAATTVAAASQPQQTLSQVASNSVPTAPIAADADPDDAPDAEFVLPENLTDKLKVLYHMWQLTPDAPVPVRCSSEHYNLISKPLIAPERSVYQAYHLPWQAAMFWFTDDDKIKQLAKSSGYCPWRYDKNLDLRDERAEAEKLRQANMGVWMPNI